MYFLKFGEYETISINTSTMSINFTNLKVKYGVPYNWASNLIGGYYTNVTSKINSLLSVLVNSLHAVSQTSLHDCN